jgi:hypothetical protein
MAVDAIAEEADEAQLGASSHRGTLALAVPPVPVEANVSAISSIGEGARASSKPTTASSSSSSSTSGYVDPRVGRGDPGEGETRD